VEIPALANILRFHTSGYKRNIFLSFPAVAFEVFSLPECGCHPFPGHRLLPMLLLRCMGHASVGGITGRDVLSQHAGVFVYFLCYIRMLFVY